MFRWTLKELSVLNSFEFAGEILLERRGRINPNSPLYKKLSESRIELRAAAERERMISPCEFDSCAYNHGGECRFARVHERAPVIDDEDGCRDFHPFDNYHPSW